MPSDVTGGDPGEQESGYSDERPATILEPNAEIQCTVAPCVNLALQQNSVPILRDLAISNLSDADLTDLELTISAVRRSQLQPSAVRIEDRIPGVPSRDDLCPFGVLACELVQLR